MTIFFTGCTHFNHKNIIKLAKRPFADVEEMNETIIQNWNAVVGPKDDVYHLGDFAWSDVTAFMARLNGRIHFLLGNHDNETKLRSVVCRWNEHVMSLAEYAEMRHNNQKFVLFHYPIDDWNGRYQGSIHLHCHTHSKNFRNAHIPFVKDSALDFESDDPGAYSLPSRYPKDMRCNRFNVGVDATNFRPVSIDEIVAESLK